ncbi:MAG: GrpB family protein [Acidimicrobiia bacterium]
MGYTMRIREPDWFEHRVLNGPDTVINLHVCTDGAEEVKRMVLLRDHLRADPDDRMRYQRAKRSLAAQEWESVQDYADAKSTVITDIMSRATAGHR